jgi:hypothetical protein
VQVVVVSFPIGEARFQRRRRVEITRPLLEVPASRIFVQAVAGVLVEDEATSRT